MAIVYVQPGSGSGAGTAGNPYYYSELATAETQAASTATPDRKILFVDGTYNITGTQTWDEPNVKYESENLHGAVFDGGSAIRTLNHSATTINKIHFKNFRFDFYTGTGTSTFDQLKVENLTAFSVGNNPGYLGGNATGRGLTITNSSFYLDVSASTGTDNRLFKFSSGLLSLRGCTFYLDATGCPANAFKTQGTNFSFTNVVISSNNSPAFSSAFDFVGNATNCCIHNIGNNTSGGTNCIFDDPQFIDLTNQDLRLRPTSPCLNKGTN